MTLTAAVDDLWAATCRLRDDVRALRLTAVEDRPLGLQSRLVDDLADGAELLDGWVAEMTAQVARLVAAAQDPAARPLVPDHLLDTTESLRRTARELHELFTCRHRVDDMVDLGRRGPREVEEWLTSLRIGVDAAGVELWGLPPALGRCWRELLRSSHAPTDTESTPRSP